MSSRLVQVYAHPLSQPSRAVLWTLALKKQPFDLVHVNIMKGEASNDTYYAKFPAGGVPAMDDDGFYLTEAHAILPYLADKYKWHDLYPTDLKQRAVVNQWLHWHHTNLRPATTLIVRPRMSAPNSPDTAKMGRKADKVLDEAFSVMKYGGLKKHPYIAGDALTLADLCLYCELDQLEAIRSFDFAPYPEVHQWMERMKQVPEHDSVRKSLHRLGLAYRAFSTVNSLWRRVTGAGGGSAAGSKL